MQPHEMVDARPYLVDTRAFPPGGVRCQRAIQVKECNGTRVIRRPGIFHIQESTLR